MAHLSATALAAAHPVHIRGIGTVIVVVVALLLAAAAIACAVRRARPASRRPPQDDWQRGRPSRDGEEPRPWP